MNDYIRHKIIHNLNRLFISFKWVVFSIIAGILIGPIGVAFYFCMDFVTRSRMLHPSLILFLPFSGLLIVGLYRILHNEQDTGTNLVLSAIHSGSKIPLRMAPLIYVATLITHLFGGSAGREGAALQLGGSLGHTLGNLFRFEEKDTHIMIMCGMSAAFSALFGTPVAAAIFSMEVVSVGVMYYAALVPCVISSLIAQEIAQYCGIIPHIFKIADIPAFSVSSAAMISLLAVLCAFVSILFCMMLHGFGFLSKKLFQNPYLRAFAGGLMIVLLTFLVGNQDYNGAGTDIIARAVSGNAFFGAFFLKMLFTALTLGTGYKGGEIVPSLFIGATFGCLFGSITGFSPSLCAAVGMSSIFCGVTNCPVTSLLISFELFGYRGVPFFLLAIAFSYMLSGYFGLYSSQKILYSKYRTTYINKEAH